jgi:hypothetical protein
MLGTLLIFFRKQIRRCTGKENKIGKEKAVKFRSLWKRSAKDHRGHEVCINLDSVILPWVFDQQ